MKITDFLMAIAKGLCVCSMVVLWLYYLKCRSFDEMINLIVRGDLIKLSLALEMFFMGFIAIFEGFMDVMIFLSGSVDQEKDEDHSQINARIPN